MDAAIENQFEMLQRMPDEGIEAYIRDLEQRRADQGERTAEMPDLQVERSQLAETSEKIYEKAKDAVKGAFNFIGEKVKWIGKVISRNKGKTILIALAAFALWYFSAPLAAGLSALKEKGIEITSSLLKESINIDPTQVDAFDQLINPLNVGPAV